MTGKAAHGGLMSVVIAALCFAPGCRRPEPSQLPEVHAGAAGIVPVKIGFQLDWYPVVEHGGYYQALLKHYYRDAGIDVAIVAGGPGEYAMPSVALGRKQLSMGTLDDVIIAIKQGLPLLIVGAQMEHNPLAVMVHAESPVTSIRQLDQRTIMCTAGAVWKDFVEARYGITINMIPDDYGLARFMADRQFIQQCFVTSEPYEVHLHGVETRTILLSEAGYDPYRVIFANKTFAREHPDAVRAFVKASIRGWDDFLYGDATEARAVIARENPAQTPALMDYSIKAMKDDHLVDGYPEKGERTGLITPTRMTDMVKVLVDLKILASPMPLDQFVSFDFLPLDLKPLVK
jgi:NitT/TauT family transport system substrate-binding protein